MTMLTTTNSPRSSPAPRRTSRFRPRGRTRLCCGPARTVDSERTAAEDRTGDAPLAGESDAARAETSGDVGAPSRWREGRLRRAGAAAAGHRVLTVAACVVVLLVAVGIGGAISRSTPGPTATSSLRPVRSAAPPRGLSPSTTIPPPSFSTEHAPTAGVGQTAKSTTGQPDLTVPSTTVPGAAPLPNGAVGQSAKIEQTGTLGLTVKPGALSSTMTKLSAIATGAGGFVASSQTQTGSGSSGPPSGTITLQVPVADFSSVLTQAEALGKTSNLTTKATDVTGQYVDLQARIDALTTTRQQYLTIMTRATSIGDVLSVQEELDSVQSQIEQLQGQLQLLNSQTAYSTMTITVNEPNSTAAGRAGARVRRSSSPGTTASTVSPTASRASSATPGPSSSRSSASACCGWADGPCGGATSVTTCSDQRGAFGHSSGRGWAPVKREFRDRCRRTAGCRASSPRRPCRSVRRPH